MVSEKKSPSIILKSKFESGKKPHMKELQKFVDYITRQEAIRQEGLNYKYTEKDLKELGRIEKALEKIENETDQPVIQDIRQMEKYIEYMTRKKAIKDNEDNEVVNGAFSNKKRFVTKDDVKEIKKLVIEAQNNHSVMFQDVISFDNAFLEKEGYYNSSTKELNEDVLYEATKGMMNKLNQKENLKDSFWFGTIHRNTDNIHIHVTCMERENTREMLEYDGVLQARGKRKQSTLDDMIFKFGSSILNRKNEFERISVLRKDVPLEIKQEVKDNLIQIYIKNNSIKDTQLETYLKELKEEIPATTRGYNELPQETKDKIDLVSTHLTKNSSKRKEYDDMTKKMDQLYQSTYGNRYEPNEFYENRKQDFNARIGNAIVSQIKSIKKSESKEISDKGLKEYLKSNHSFSQNKNIKPDFKTKYGQQRFQEFQNKVRQKNIVQEKRSVVYEKKQEQYKDKITLRKIEKAINDDLKMYRAEQDYERLSQEIERHKQMQEQGYDFS